MLVIRAAMPALPILCAMPALLILCAVPARANTLAVPVAVLTPIAWRATEELPASVDAQEKAVLAAARAGQVAQVFCSSGQTVASGTVLVQLDDAPETAQANLDRARLGQAQKALARDLQLMKISGTSQANLEEAQANVAEAVAQLAVDNAMLAQLRITAPFAGIIGIRQISPGDYLQQGQAVLSLTQPTPLRILFSIPQTEAEGVAAGDGFTFAVAAQPGSEMQVAGRITALSPQFDAATNARGVEGAVLSSNTALLPGMQGVVTLQTGPPTPAFSLPATALNDGTLGRYIYVLNQTGNGNFIVHAVYVTALAQSGAIAVITATGLRPGQQVVAEGGFNLTDGASVTLQAP